MAAMKIRSTCAGSRRVENHPCLTVFPVNPILPGCSVAPRDRNKRSLPILPGNPRIACGRQTSPPAHPPTPPLDVEDLHEKRIPRCVGYAPGRYDRDPCPGTRGAGCPAGCASADLRCTRRRAGRHAEQCDAAAVRARGAGRSGAAKHRLGSADGALEAHWAGDGRYLGERRLPPLVGAQRADRRPTRNQRLDRRLCRRRPGPPGYASFWAIRPLASARFPGCACKPACRWPGA